MDLSTIQSSEEYLKHYREFTENCFSNEYPLLDSFYKELHHRFLKVASQKEGQVFAQLRELLAIDAQLQILYEMAEYIESLKLEMNEEKIVEMIKRDSESFYRERMGLTKKDPIPRGLIYLSEK
ncbi:DUF7006 family protein [Enterococcus mundtii]|uniref:Uncharacterized protein n=1 Tax=Enterococcus mundtii TaxID=53346 RepID=A0A2S7RN01_ENTMU|nr:hypothetical protein [Enterococcus mundtii]MDA9460190.1 hypothetical protein [Enterococcus mundtii 3F]PQF20110.1 hypothetical protein CUS89_15400 [Enterococcus mundtii]PTO39683.1 hypothetical protein C6P52_04050 [Enterococcus mundtii]PTO45258.1 hypothetical protein C6P54_00925 [Enterococcus mundtii]